MSNHDEEQRGPPPKACCACRHQHKKCEPGRPFLRYFPPGAENSWLYSIKEHGAINMIPRPALSMKPSSAPKIPPKKLGFSEAKLKDVTRQLELYRQVYGNIATTHHVQAEIINPISFGGLAQNSSRGNYTNNDNNVIVGSDHEIMQQNFQDNSLLELNLQYPFYQQQQNLEVQDNNYQNGVGRSEINPASSRGFAQNSSQRNFTNNVIEDNPRLELGVQYLPARQ
ncbi:hypothetical protein L484_019498 [Morus notabilis]|uniref:LOB domain-containing protein n=1 Tax=Morus notabilis TaxID=981085 RepID=W9R3E4_9ROSA|nr:hypothetical protein L484_019498 [Morus notabilis]